MKHLQFPIGEFVPPENITTEMRQTWIRTIEELPHQLELILEKASVEQLATPYRTGGWTVAQVIHHLADSHTNSFIRFKLALTEEFPIIKPYLENLWAELPDSNTSYPIESSVMILIGLHQRWAHLLKQISENQYKTCGFYHPEKQRNVLLEEALALYAWHCNHHLAHIKLVIR